MFLEASVSPLTGSPRQTALDPQKLAFEALGVFRVRQADSKLEFDRNEGVVPSVVTNYNIHAAVESALTRNRVSVSQDNAKLYLDVLKRMRNLALAESKRS